MPPKQEIDRISFEMSLHCRGFQSMVCGPLTARRFMRSNLFPSEHETITGHFHCADICTDTAKPVVAKTAGTLAQVEIVAPNCTSSHTKVY